MILIKVVYLSIFVSVVTCAKLPSVFKRCKKQDQVCLKEAIQEGIPEFGKGFRSMGILGIDPLSIPQMEIPGGSGTVTINQKVKNGLLYGLSTVILENIRFDIDAGKAHLNFRCSNLTIRANYEMTGQIMVLPVNGNGHMDVVIENIRGDEEITTVQYERDNDKYLKVTDSVLKLEAGHVSFNLENVFDGNKQLSDQINQVMNDNWSIVFDEIKGGYNDAIRIFVDHIVNNFFSKIPLSEIFLDY